MSTIVDAICKKNHDPAFRKAVQEAFNAGRDSRQFMGLFEIATGYMGCSFERCYVWAETATRAKELFWEYHPEREIKAIVLIVHRDDGEFITKLDDEGVGERIAQ